MLCKPSTKDAKEICKIIQNCPPLDVNSEYLYLLLCQHFSDSCVVTKTQDNSNIIGFVSAYIPPTKKDTLFVWQVAVDKHYRGKGIAAKMIQAILSRSICNEVLFLEATVTPSNNLSKNLFESIASKLDAKSDTYPFFTKGKFEYDHEAEDLVRIGPIQKPNNIEVSMH